MKLYKLLSLVLFLCSSVSFGQQTAIRGIITDANSRETLPGVHIISDDSSATVSDAQGKFLLKCNAGTHEITFSYIGYTSQKQRYTLIVNDTLLLKIKLESSSAQLGTVVVSASRYEQKIEETTVSMEVIKPSYISNTATSNMETVINQVPGVTVMDGSVAIRGGSGFSYGAGSRVLLLVDDMPMLAADAGDVKWTALATENIEQVEIIKGASSALFGSSALNGVMNMRTAFPKDSAEGKIMLHHGVYDNPARKELKWWKNANPSFSGTNFSYRKKFGQFDLCTGGNLFSDEGFRMGEKEQRMRFNVNTRYRFKKVDGLSAGINLNYIQTQGGNFLIWQNDSNGAYLPLGGLDTPTTTLSNYVTNRMTVDPYLNYHGKNGATHKLHGRFFRSNNTNDSQQESLADFYFGEYVFGKKFKSDLQLTLGAGASANIVRSGLYGDHQGKNYFGFAQVEKKFFERLTVAFGVRVEYFNMDTAETRADIYLLPDAFKNKILLAKNSQVKPVKRLGLNYRLLKATHLRASYGEGYRFPTIAEKYIRTNAGAIYIFPNDSVRPETGWSAEVGIRQGIKIGAWSASVDVAAFYTAYKDMMEFSFGRWDTAPPPGTLGIGFKSRNISDATISGLDVSISSGGKLGAFTLAIMAGYTYMNPIQQNFNPAVDTVYGTANFNILKYRFKHMAKADVEIGYKRIALGISFRYNSYMENIDRAFSEFIPGVKHYRLTQAREDYVLDGRLSYLIGKDLKISFLSKNALNREYMGRPADMQAPRSFLLQAEMKF